MGVRNCSEIGENLQKIVKRLMANDRLVNLLYYTDVDPISHAPLSDEQKRAEVFEKLIRVVPRIPPKEDSTSIVTIRVDRGVKISDNQEYRTVSLTVEVFVPMTQWLIKETNLRPFAILGEVQKSLEGKTVNGLGKLSGGDFELSVLTDEMSIYESHYEVINYE